LPLPLHLDVLDFFRAGKKLRQALIFVAVLEDVCCQIFPEKLLRQLVAQHFLERRIHL